VRERERERERKEKTGAVCNDCAAGKTGPSRSCTSDLFEPKSTTRVGVPWSDGASLASAACAAFSVDAWAIEPLKEQAQRQTSLLVKSTVLDLGTRIEIMIMIVGPCLVKTGRGKRVALQPSQVEKAAKLGLFAKRIDCVLSCGGAQHVPVVKVDDGLWARHGHLALRGNLRVGLGSGGARMVALKIESGPCLPQGPPPGHAQALMAPAMGD